LSILRDFNPSAFSLLFDLKDNDGSGLVGQHKSCQDGQLYDPFGKKCRQVYCPQTGQTFREGRCLDPIISTTSTTTEETVTGKISSVASIPPSVPTVSTTEGSTNEGGTFIYPEEISTTKKPTEETTASSTQNSAPKSAYPINTPTTTTETTTPATTITVSQTTTNMVGNSSLVTNETAESFASCPKFLLTAGEVEWMENGTLYVRSHKQSYDIGQFRKEEDGSVLICAKGVSSVSKFDPVLGWVTVAGLGLSELCLALHLTAFLISPELRNLSGRNLASLSLALFSAYGLFMAAQFIPTGDSVCFGVAVSTYYFFLAAFWWTSVLAWDVWRTIRMATVQLRSSSGQRWGKFVLYSAYAWLVPALIVAGTLVVELVDVGEKPLVPAEFHPSFGKNVCWFGQRKALLVFFAAPLSAVLGVNLILFLSSVYMIRSTTSKSPTSSNNQSGTRKQLGLYIRLALIMGLSWIAGLIAGGADFTPLWYVFVGLCSLQGVFILLAYTCQPKVSRSIRSRIRICPTKRVTYRTTYRTTLAGGIKGEHLRRLGLEARDSHDSQASNVSQASQTSQTSLTKTSSNTTSP
jgi:hypothetical protein